MACTPIANSRTPLAVGETLVQSALAYTPADMQRMAEKGVSINSMNMEGSYYYDAPTKSFDVPLQDSRGIDPADIWNAQMEARNKLSKADKSSRAKKAAEELNNG